MCAGSAHRHFATGVDIRLPDMTLLEVRVLSTNVMSAEAGTHVTSKIEASAGNGHNQSR